MRISKKTLHQIDELERIVHLTPIGRALIERIVAEAAHDAASSTAQTMRKLAADEVVEQRHQIYERLREVSSC